MSNASDICFPITNNWPSHNSEKGEVYYLFKPSSKMFLGEIKTIVFKASQGHWHVTHVIGRSL